MSLNSLLNSSSHFIIALSFSLTSSFFFNSLLLSATSRCFCFHFITSSLTSFSSISLKPSSLIGFCSKTEVSFRIVSQFLGFFLREISKLFLSLYVLKTSSKLFFKSKAHHSMEQCVSEKTLE